MITLAMIVVLAGGQITYSTQPNIPTLKACWAAADKYIHEDPSKYDGIALGAGCIVSGRPA